MIRHVFSLLGYLGCASILSWSASGPAFEWRSGNVIGIGSGETLNDDLYAAGKSISIDGIVNGDVVAFGQHVAVNGTINGNLFAAAQDIIVKGTVTGNLRGAGNTIYLGEKAHIGHDLLGASESLELQKGSMVGRDLLYASAEATLAGTVARNVTIAGEGVRISGAVGGNVKAQVAEKSAREHERMHWFMNDNAIEAARAAPGLTIDKGAKLSGDLTYSQSKELSFPAGTILGKVTRTEPSYETMPHRSVGHWALDFLRLTLALLLMGFLLIWIFPRIFTAASEHLRAHPGRSFASGCLAFGLVIAGILVITIAAVLLAILFGLLTLSTLSATMVFGGILSDFALILGFAFVAVFVAKIVVGITLGEWLLHKLKSPLAAHKYWPMIVGVPALMIVVALVSMPWLPAFLGGLLRFVVLLFGLGGLWIWFRGLFHRSV